MPRLTSGCPHLPWIHVCQPCERPDRASVRALWHLCARRPARHPLLRVPQRSACCRGLVAATEHSRCRSALLSLTHTWLVRRYRFLLVHAGALGAAAACACAVPHAIRCSGSSTECLLPRFGCCYRALSLQIRAAFSLSHTLLVRRYRFLLPRCSRSTCRVLRASGRRGGQRC